MPKGKAAAVTEADFTTPYVAAITKFADLDRIARAGFKIAIDAMYGSGRGVLAGIFCARGIKHVEIRGELNPLFPGINPEPIEPHIQMLRETVQREGCQAGFATDGDADRIGAVAEDGSFVDAHKIFCLLLRWLVERKQWPGEVARAFNTTGMVDRICARHGRKLHETGIGFKYLCELMLTREMLIVGEESGGIGIPRHLPERDGILNSLLLAGIMAEEGRTLAQLVAGLQKEYGPHYFGRRDLHMTEEAKVAAMRRIAAGLERVGRYKVLRTASTDGVKFFLDAPTPDHGAEPWVLMRASGTEHLLRLYAEAASPDLVEEILAAGEAFVKGSS
jgi:phosphomannomutase